MSAPPVLAAESVSKRYGAVSALEDVSLEVRAGEVVCLLGDNGAGKSTLIRILSGATEPSAGRLLVDGAPSRFASPADARARGIDTVYQDLAVLPLMSIWRNFFLGAEPVRRLGPLRWLDAERARRIARDELGHLGMDAVDPDRLAGTLSGGQRQALAIARALHFGARVLILDEPTAALGVKQARRVLEHVAAARARGAGVLLVTHNPRHALDVGDRFVVLRRGRLAAQPPRAGLGVEALARLMSGEGDDGEGPGSGTPHGA